MQLHTINTGFFKLDGGAMFGVVPQSIWKNINPPDANNMCTWAMRCLLINTGNRLILVDTGIGNKQADKFFAHYNLHGADTLVSSIQAQGYGLDDITDVVFTHLHFDHCGGAIIRDGDNLVPLFPKANYWTHSAHWTWATQPNAREKASFLSENILPIQATGQLKYIDKEAFGVADMDFITVSGHTESMLLPKIKYKENTLVYCADLLASAGHIPLPYIMAYDTRPLLSLDEKADFLNQAAANNWVLMYEHDPVNECSTVINTERSVKLGDTMKLSEV